MSLVSLLLLGTVGAQEGSFCESRLFDLGGYYLEVGECLSLSNGGSITYFDSVEKDTLAYVNLFMNGGVVKYDDFLGVTDLKVEVPVFGSDQPVDYLGARSLIESFYDIGRFSPNKLTKREMKKGNSLFEKLLLDSLEGERSGVHSARPVSFDTLSEGVEDYLVRMDDRCIECEGLPAQRRLRAVVEYMLDNKIVVDGKFVWDLNFGGNGVRIDVSQGLDLVVIRSDLGKAYWDGGEFGHLDGEVDMVSASYPFLRSEFDSSLGLHVVCEDLSAHQWVNDTLIEMLHESLPEWYKVVQEQYIDEEEAKMP